jgi:hypothetical protein
MNEMITAFEKSVEASAELTNAIKIAKALKQPLAEK